MTIKSWTGSSAVAAFAAAIAFCGMQPALAQDASGTGLVNQIQMLRTQNSQLLGQIQVLQHEIDQLKQASKQQYIVLDTRIKRLEKAQASAQEAAKASATAEAESRAKAKKAGAAGKSLAKATTTAKAAQPAAAPATPGTVLTSDKNAAKVYNAALDQLRGGDFAGAADSFLSFTMQYPHDTLTPNAWYWLGESYYVTQKYKQALDAFEKVLTLFPDSSKGPAALLKKGFSQDALNQTDKAKATLQMVIKRYPGSSVAKLAQERLQDIKLQQQLK